MVVSGCAEIVKQYRYQLGANLSRLVNQAEFAEMLAEGLVNIPPVTRVTVSAWETGKWEPDTDFLLALLARYAGTGDWREQFARDCLRAKIPEVFDAGVVLFAGELPG
ncbi:XRE family transcriptional regulator [Candidatus Parcubacteria bacterium]|nr:MAG: XRE family transcriptional regulator [Candidatus Parcubacteria bacterium]